MSLNVVCLKSSGRALIGIESPGSLSIRHMVGSDSFIYVRPCVHFWHAYGFIIINPFLSICHAHSGYFMSLQSCSREGEGLEPNDLVRYSHLYRSALHECVVGLRKMACSEDDRKMADGEAYRIVCTHTHSPSCYALALPHAEGPLLVNLSVCKDFSLCSSQL